VAECLVDLQEGTPQWSALRSTVDKACQLSKA
jgi:hypothetical protein